MHDIGYTYGDVNYLLYKVCTNNIPNGSDLFDPVLFPWKQNEMQELLGCKICCGL